MSYESDVAPYVASLRMIREEIEELFGPVASLAGLEQTGAAPEDEAVAIIEALQRVRAALDRKAQ